MRAAQRIVKNISQGRKLFKFFKSVDEMKAIESLITRWNDKWWLIQWLNLYKRVCGTFYYMFDNIMWVADTGIIAQTSFLTLKWKSLKDWIVLSKNWAEIIKSVFELYHEKQKEHKIIDKLVSNAELLQEERAAKR